MNLKLCAVVIGVMGFSFSLFAQWSTNGSTIYLTDSTNKKLGIGTKTSNYKMRVQSLDNFTSGEHFIADFVRLAGNNDCQLILGYRANGSSVTANLIRSGNSLPLTFGTSAANEAVTILNNGNVGIGTVNPTPHFSGKALIINNPSARAMIELWDGSASNQKAIFQQVGAVTYLGNLGNSSDSWVSGNDVVFSAGGGKAAITILGANGNVGIGTTQPGAKLEVYGQDANFFSGTPTNVLMVGRYPGEGFTISVNDYTTCLESVQDEDAPGYGNMVFRVANDGTANGFFAFQNKAGSEFMRINSSGNVGIGTTNPGTAKLAVNGTIKAREVIATTQGWPDYVFDTEYDLKPLPEVEKFIKTNKHLENIPTAAEVKTNGVPLADMQAKILQKLEETTLYLIEMKKENEVLKSRITVLEQNGR